MKTKPITKTWEDPAYEKPVLVSGWANFLISLVVFLILLLMMNPTYAQIAGKWRGFDDTNWNNTNNWDDGAVPDNTIDVVIPSGCTNYPTTIKKLVVGAGFIAGDIYRCKSLEIQSGANIFSEDSLWVNGTMTVAGLYLYDNHWLSGTHIINAGGSLTITSTGSAFIGQYGVISSSKQDLIVNTGGSLSNAGYFSVNDCLIIHSGASFTMTGNIAFIMGWEGDYNSTCPASFYVASGASGGVTGGEVYVQGKEKSGYYAIDIREPTFDFTGTSKFTIYTEGDQAPAYPDFDVNIVSGVEFYDVVVNNNGSTSTLYGTMKVNNDMNIEAPSSLTIASGATLNITNDLFMKTNLGPQSTFYASLIDLGQLTVGGDSQLQWSIQGQQWHLVASPVSNETANLFNGMYLQQFTESTNAWTDITSLSYQLGVMQGYAAWFDDNWWQGIYFTGDLNTGNIGSDNNLTKNNQGWNLVGNPYPSPIDWDATTGWTKTNLNTAIYLENNGNWATYNNGVGTNGGSRYIAPCHGFFVQANAHPATLKMSNTVRVHNKPVYFKSGLNNFVRLEISNTDQTNPVYTDELVVRIHPDATPGFDGKLDAHKLFASNPDIPQIYCTHQTLAINAIPEIKPVDIMLLTGEPGTYQISVEDWEGLENIYLVDKFTGNECDLNQQAYCFTSYNSDPQDRFTLDFKASGIEPDVNQDEAPITIFAENGHIHIVPDGKFINQLANKNLSVRIYDVVGREVYFNELNAGSTSTISAPGKGIFIVNIKVQEFERTVKTRVF
nr:T9SS type A sorting domain-containing protein [Bacteroidota bacterium]